MLQRSSYPYAHPRVPSQPLPSRLAPFWRVLAAVCLLALPSLTFAQAHFSAHLSGTQENPPVAGGGSGTASLTLTEKGLQYFITVQGLSGAITAAHIHSGARGVNGGVLFNLGPSFFTGNPGSTQTAHGIWAGLSSAQIASLLNGDLYINVHTAANPGGEIRGQIDLSGGTHFRANLTDDQENPATGAAGLGTGSFTLTEEGLEYQITVNGLTGGITAAHLHRADIGVNGGVVFDIGASFGGGTTARGIWSRGVGAPNLTTADIVDLLMGRLYVNVHTAANPGGEIRGQLQLASGFGFSAKLDEGSEVPPSGAPGQGSASFTLTPSGLVYDISVENLTGAITGAHFHNAAPGANGGVVRDIGASFVGLNARGVWRPDDAMPLTNQLISELLAGNIYVNVHTAANPGGEIRGNLSFNSGRTTLAAHLTDDQEVPPTGAAAVGTGTFRLGPAGLDFDITVHNLTGAITAAHFHLAPIGVNGGVIFNLGPSVVGNNIRGTWAGITTAQIKDLLKGNYYVNVHTAANPGGEIRGQVLLSSGCGFRMDLTGDQEEPPVVAAGRGTGSATLTSNGYAYGITVSNLSGGVSAAHFHGGTTGVSGGVIRDFSALVVAGHVEDVWHPADAQPLTAARVDELFLGTVYANFHTAANPGGEIRGQNMYSEGFHTGYALIGGAEVPPVATSGMGTSSVSLSEGGLRYAVSFNDLNGAFTASHFHNAPAGVNGGVVFNITSSFVANTGRGTWKQTSATPLTAALMGAYFEDELYINVHSAAHPGGEIRTQQTEITTSDAPVPLADRLLWVQATPNPVTSHSVIRYALPQASPVRLRLIDASGALVRTIFDGSSEAGTHTLELDGRGLSSGVYFMHLQAGTEVATERMLIVR